MNQMRSSQKNRNARHKGGRPNKPSGNVVNRVYESAGPEGKVRGTPQQIIDKYLLLARDAQTSGDRVTAENFLQHAEHYVRLLNAAMPPQEDRRFMQQPAYAGDDDMGEDGGEERSQDTRQNDDRQHDGRQHDGRQPEWRGQENRRPEQRHGDERRRDDRRPDERRYPEQRDETQPAAPAEAAPQPEMTAAEPVAVVEAQAAHAMPPATSGLETIDTTEPDEGGPVATPEAMAEEEPKPKPRRRTRKPRAVDEVPAEG